MADSYRSISFVLMNRLGQTCGVAGYALNNYRNSLMWQLSGGARLMPPSRFWFTDHLQIPAGGSVYWETLPAGGVVSSRAGLFYVLHPAGGQLDILISTNSGPWGKIATINTFSPELRGASTNFNLYLNRHRIRVDALSGTNYIIGPQLLNKESRGVQAAFADQPGISLSTVTNVPVAIRDAILAGLQPDLIIWHMKEDGSEATRARLLENEQWWRSAAPGADVLYIGTPWVSTDATTGITTAQNALVRSVAVQYDRAYVDCQGPSISYDWMLGQGYMSDGTHISLQGSTFLANRVWNDLGFFALRVPRQLLLQKFGQEAALKFDTRKNLIYTVESSPDLSGWTPILSQRGMGRSESLNVPLTNRSALFRLQLSPAD